MYEEILIKILAQEPNNSMLRGKLKNKYISEVLSIVPLLDVAKIEQYFQQDVNHLQIEKKLTKEIVYDLGDFLTYRLLKK